MGLVRPGATKATRGGLVDAYGSWMITLPTLTKRAHQPEHRDVSLGVPHPIGIDVFAAACAPEQQS